MRRPMKGEFEPGNRVYGIGSTTPWDARGKVVGYRKKDTIRVRWDKNKAQHREGQIKTVSVYDVRLTQAEVNKRSRRNWKPKR